METETKGCIGNSFTAVAAFGSSDFIGLAGEA